MNSKQHPIWAQQPVTPEMVAAKLTDEQCDEFRRHQGSFNDMVRAIYEAGRTSAQSAANLAFGTHYRNRYNNLVAGHQLVPEDAVVVSADFIQQVRTMLAKFDCANSIPQTYSMLAAERKPGLLAWQEFHRARRVVEAALSASEVNHNG